MNYQKIYNDIINKAKSLNRKKFKRDNSLYVYYEKHHILPKCLEGNNDKENLVLLTAKEHYVCHKLLTYIYKNNLKVAYAFNRMTFDKKGKHNISVKDYAYARELMSSIFQGGYKLSEETKQKMRKPKSDLHKQHIKIVTKLWSGKNQLGKTRRKYIKHKEDKLCSYCNKLISNNMFSRWHGEKCAKKAC